MTVLSNITITTSCVFNTVYIFVGMEITFFIKASVADERKCFGRQIACEQALLFGWVKGVSRERESERRSRRGRGKESLQRSLIKFNLYFAQTKGNTISFPFLGPSLALTSLAQIGEFARRLVARWNFLVASYILNVSHSRYFRGKCKIVDGAPCCGLLLNRRTREIRERINNSILSEFLVYNKERSLCSVLKT